MPLPSPTGKQRLLAKSGWQRERQLCQQLALPTASGEAVGKAGACFRGSPALPTAWPKAVGKGGKAGEESPALPTTLAHAVGKAGNFSLFFCSFLAFNSHIKSTHQHMNQNTTYISTI
jgi:hypothetical protein